MLLGVLFFLAVLFIAAQSIVICLLVQLVNKERSIKKAERELSRNFIKALSLAYSNEKIDRDDFEDAYKKCYKEYVKETKIRKEKEIQYEELKDAYQVLCENIFDYINKDAKANEAFSDEFKRLDTSKVIQLFNIKAI